MTVATATKTCNSIRVQWVLGLETGIVLTLVRVWQKTVIKVLPFYHKRLISNGDTINVSITHQLLPSCGQDHSTMATVHVS